MAGDPRGGATRLLVLGAGAAQLGLLEAARERGLYVIAVDRDPAAAGFHLADRRALVSTEDETGVERLASAERVDGIVSPGADWPVAVAARVAARLGLRHPLTPEAAVLATSKLRQRERLGEEGIPQPRWQVVTRPDDSLGFPCVVKAPDRQGQRGLSLVSSADELPAAVEAAIEASRSRSCVIEELEQGPEVTVNGFLVAGRLHPLTVTDRLTADPPAFGVALAHVHPSEHAVERAVELSGRAAAALGVTKGPLYVQLRLGPEGPQVVELAARLGGGHDAELCRAALGVDLNGLAISAALGEEVEPSAPEPRVGGACVRFLVAPPGELQEVVGIEDAEGVEGIEWVRSYRPAGHVFAPLRIGPDRAGAVLATGATRGEALERAAAAADSIRFVTAHAEAVLNP